MPHGEKGYPGYLPLVARDSYGCAGEPPKPWPHGLPEGPCAGGTSHTSWKCYSALALTPDKTAWSNKAKHPNAYCSGPGSALAAIAKDC